MDRLTKKLTSLLLSLALVLGVAGSAIPANVRAADEGVSKVTVTFYGDSKTSKGFTWYTLLNSQSSDLQVVEKTSDGQPDFAEALEFEGRSEIAVISPEERSHKAEATGLTPGTSYYFRVGDKELGIWSETGTFETAPAEEVPFTFIDLTDTQAQDEEEAALSAATLAKALKTIPEAKFVVHNGDVVEHSAEEKEWGWLLDFSKDSLLHTTIAPASGNHDNKQFSFYQHFNVSAPEGSDTETGAYYSFDYSNAHFVVLNSNENSIEFRNFSLEQVEWLKKDVTAAREAGAKWIIVSIHKGPYTTANHATDGDIISPNGERYTIAPLMNELGVDLVLQGHDHIYARSKPIKANGTAEEATKITETLNGETIEYAVDPDGSIYLIPGTAGAKAYFKNRKPELGEAYFSLFDREEENHAQKYGLNSSDMRGQVQNFVGVSIDGDKLTAVTYEIDQNLNNAEPFIVDQFGIVKETGEGPGRLAETDPAGPAPTDPGSNAPAVELSDIEGHWAQPVIARAIAAGFINGYDDGTFRPNQGINRAEFVAMLGRSLFLPDLGGDLDFTDAEQIPNWAAPYVGYFVEAGLISGYDDGSFSGDKPITRTEMVAIMVRVSGIPVNPAATAPFADADEIPNWAVAYVAAAAPYLVSAVNEGFIENVGDNLFAPQRVVTRAEAIAMIVGVLGG